MLSHRPYTLRNGIGISTTDDKSRLRCCLKSQANIRVVTERSNRLRRGTSGRVLHGQTSSCWAEQYRSAHRIAEPRPGPSQCTLQIERDDEPQTGIRLEIDSIVCDNRFVVSLGSSCDQTKYRLNTWRVITRIVTMHTERIIAGNINLPRGVSHCAEAQREYRFQLQVPPSRIRC